MSDGPAAVEVEGVSFAYEGGPTVLEGVSLRVEAGEFLALLGPNGGGKTTLVKLMLGFEEPRSGRVRLFGMTPRAALRKGVVGSVPQRAEAERTLPLTVAQVVRLSAGARTPFWRGLGAESSAHAAQAVELVGLEAQSATPVGELSGGQFQRMLIARALARRPRLLVLDEPTIGIDPAGQQRFNALLARLHTELGIAIVLVSHDLRTVAAGAQRCDRVACLARTLHFHAAPEGLTPGVLAEVFRHDLAGAFGEVHVDAHTAAQCPGDHAHGGGG